MRSTEAIHGRTFMGRILSAVFIHDNNFEEVSLLFSLTHNS